MGTDNALAHLLELTVGPSLLACFLGGLLCLLARVRTLFAPLAQAEGRRHAIVLAAIVLLGGLLRFVVSPHVPLNLDDFLRGPGNVGEQGSMAATSTFFSALFAVAGGPFRIEPVMPVMAALGTLTLPLVFALAARLSKDLWAAQAATMLLAILPLHERYSDRENTEPLMVFTIVAGLACLAAWADSRDGVLLAGGSLWLLFATLTHGEARSIVLVAALLVLLRWPRGRDLRRSVLPFAIALAVGLPVLLRLGSGHLPTGPGHELPPLTLSDLFHPVIAYALHSGFQTPLLAVAALVGIFVGNRIGVLVCVAWTVALVLVFFLANQTEDNCIFGNARYFLGWLPALCILAGMAIGRFASLAGGRRPSWRGPAAAMATGALVVAQLAHSGVAVYRAEWNDQLQWRFLARAVADLPAGATVALPPPASDCCIQQVLSFDQIVRARRPDVHLLDPPPPAKWDPRQLPADAVAFVGLSCYVGQAGTPRLSPDCRRLADEMRLDPLATETIQNHPYFLYDPAEYLRWTADPTGVAGTLDLGLYRVHPRRQAGAQTGPGVGTAGAPARPMPPGGRADRGG